MAAGRSTASGGRVSCSWLRLVATVAENNAVDSLDAGDLNGVRASPRRVTAPGRVALLRLAIRLSGCR